MRIAQEDECLDGHIDIVRECINLEIVLVYCSNFTINSPHHLMVNIPKLVRTVRGFFCLFVFKTVCSRCSPGCPGTDSVDQAVLRNPPASVS